MGNENEAWKEEVYYTHRSERVTACHAKPQKKVPVSVRNQKIGKSLGQSLYWGFLKKGKRGQSKQFRFG